MFLLTLGTVFSINDTVFFQVEDERAGVVVWTWCVYRLAPLANLVGERSICMSLGVGSGAHIRTEHMRY